jgi:hypothetical protein
MDDVHASSRINNSSVSSSTIRGLGSSSSGTVAGMEPASIAHGVGAAGGGGAASDCGLVAAVAISGACDYNLGE